MRGDRRHLNIFQISLIVNIGENAGIAPVVINLNPRHNNDSSFEEYTTPERKSPLGMCSKINCGNFNTFAYPSYLKCGLKKTENTC